MLDFLKKKELSRIAELEKELQSFEKFKNIRNLSLESQRLSKEIETKQKELESKMQTLAMYTRLEDLSLELNNYSLAIREKQKEIYTLSQNFEELNSNIKIKQKEIVELDNTILLQEFGIYTPIFDFASSAEFKTRLEEVRTQQKQMILDWTATTVSKIWTVDGSTEKGRKMTEQNIKLILRCFNDECDVLVAKVKFNNINTYIEKIKRSYNAINRMNTRYCISITEKYLNLKIEELQLAYEYAVKKEKEKEEERRQREILREEAKLQKEIEEARKDVEKEQKHYNNALDKIEKQLAECKEEERQLLLDKKSEIEQHLSELDSAMENIDYREANKRAGYVYVISNIGSFGENVYKIGMTRRLDPMERVNELGDASVPFSFDVHALIFSEDAPALETALHHAFDKKRVNMTNNRREFFKVSIEEIEKVVKENYDKTVEFVTTPEAEQYRESVKLRNNI